MLLRTHVSFRGEVAHVCEYQCVSSIDCRRELRDVSWQLPPSVNVQIESSESYHGVSVTVLRYSSITQWLLCLKNAPIASKYRWRHRFRWADCSRRCKSKWRGMVDEIVRWGTVMIKRQWNFWLVCMSCVCSSHTPFDATARCGMSSVGPTCWFDFPCKSGKITFIRCLPVGNPERTVNELVKFFVVSDGALAYYEGGDSDAVADIQRKAGQFSYVKRARVFIVYHLLRTVH